MGVPEDPDTCRLRGQVQIRAVVVGNPSRIVRYRFSKEVIEELLESKWWEKEIDEIVPEIKDYQQSYEDLYNKRHSTSEKSEGEPGTPSGVEDSATQSV